MRFSILGAVIGLCLAVALYFYPSFFRPGTVASYQSGSYTADGMPARYFGNDAKGDLNGDGVPDAAFLVTAEGGGSGTFYYAIAALKTADGYKPTNAIFLGDRIAPEATEIRNGEVIINYADRAPGEPMTARPSVGVSKYLKVQGTTLVEMSRP